MPRPYDRSTNAGGVPVCLTRQPRQIIAGVECEFSSLGEWTRVASRTFYRHRSATARVCSAISVRTKADG